MPREHPPSLTAALTPITVPMSGLSGARPLRGRCPKPPPSLRRSGRHSPGSSRRSPGPSGHRLPSRSRIILCLRALNSRSPRRALGSTAWALGRVQRPEPGPGNAGPQKGPGKSPLQSAGSGRRPHTSRGSCHNVSLQGNQHKRKLAEALVHPTENKTAAWRLPNSNLIQKNKQGITQQSPSPRSEEYPLGAKSFMGHLPHLRLQQQVD